VVYGDGRITDGRWTGFPFGEERYDEREDRRSTSHTASLSIEERQYLPTPDRWQGLLWRSPAPCPPSPERGRHSSSRSDPGLWPKRCTARPKACAPAMTPRAAPSTAHAASIVPGRGLERSNSPGRIQDSTVTNYLPSPPEDSCARPKAGRSFFNGYRARLGRGCWRRASNPEPSGCGGRARGSSPDRIVP
jgi:hypothetical protein